MTRPRQGHTDTTSYQNNGCAICCENNALRKTDELFSRPWFVLLLHSASCRGSVPGGYRPNGIPARPYHSACVCAGVLAGALWW